MHAFTTCYHAALGQATVAFNLFASICAFNLFLICCPIHPLEPLSVSAEA